MCEVGAPLVRRVIGVAIGIDRPKTWASPRPQKNYLRGSPEGERAPGKKLGVKGTIITPCQGLPADAAFFWVLAGGVTRGVR